MPRRPPAPSRSPAAPRPAPDRRAAGPPPEVVDHPRFGRVAIRPVRADDAPRIREGFLRQAPEDLRLRFFGRVTELPADFVARATRFAPDEATFVAEGPDGALLGGVRLARAPAAGGGARGRSGGRAARGGGAEFAISVASRAKRAGLGRLLMERMLRHARAGGVVRVWGDVMAENAAMLRLAGALGFRLERIADQPAIMRATLDLR